MSLEKMKDPYALVVTIYGANSLKSEIVNVTSSFE